MFASIYCYIKFRLSQTSAVLNPSYYFSVCFFRLHFYPKNPASSCHIIGICDFVLLDPKKPFLQRIVIILRAIWPFAILAAIYIYLRATKLNFVNTFNFYNEQTEFTSSLWLRFSISFKYCKFILVYCSARMTSGSNVLSKCPKHYLNPMLFLVVQYFWGFCIPLGSIGKKSRSSPLALYGSLSD